MEYINRRGQTYYVFAGKTKTGKPRFFASKKPASDNASRIDTLPAEYEIFENPVDAVVVIRRRRPTKLTAADRNLLNRLALEHSEVACEIVIEGDSLIVYSSPMPRSDPALEAMMPGLGKFLVHGTHGARLEPGFKFTLANEKQRLFTIARYCCRSSMDGWLELHDRPASLDVLASQFFPHLGEDSFFELL